MRKRNIGAIYARIERKAQKSLRKNRSTAAKQDALIKRAPGSFENGKRR